MIKASVPQEDIKILNVYTPNSRSSNYVREKLIELQREINESTTIVGDYNTPLSEMDRSSRQDISKNLVELNNTVNQLDIIDTYRLLHLTTTEHMFLRLTWSIQDRPHSVP